MIQGTWIPTSAELGGNPFPQEVLRSMKLILTETQYTAIVGNTTDTGRLTLHPDLRPSGMDILGAEGPNKGKTILAIYELSGDSLKICYDLRGKSRPREFNTGVDAQRFLVSYKRVT